MDVHSYAKWNQFWNWVNLISCELQKLFKLIWIRSHLSIYTLNCLRTRAQILWSVRCGGYCCKFPCHWRMLLVRSAPERYLNLKLWHEYVSAENVIASTRLLGVMTNDYAVSFHCVHSSLMLFHPLCYITKIIQFLIEVPGILLPMPCGINTLHDSVSTSFASWQRFPSIFQA